MLQSRKIRDQKGAAITGLVIALMFFMLIAGLFAFDASRVQMAQRELTATCDASALAGTAMLTSYDVSDDPGYIKLANAQQNAAAYAYNMFQMGNVLGRFVQGHCTPVATLSALGTSTDGNCNIVLGLVDPKNNFATVDFNPPNNANGRAIAVFAGYGYHPMFISFFGVGNVGITASSIGGLPQVDTVLVFDYSGSMDDLTKVTLVKRWWNAMPVNGFTGADSLNWTVDAATINPIIGITLTQPAQVNLNLKVPGLIEAGYPGANAAQLNKGCIQYDEAPHPSGNQSLQNYVGLDLTNFLQGTSLNVLPPQNLANSELGTTQTGDQIIVFKQFLRHHFNNNDYGSPPGNCPAFIAGGGSYVSVVGDTTAYGEHMYNGASPSTLSNPPQTASIPGGSLTSAMHYPSYSGRSGKSGLTNWRNIYTDLVVNIKNVAKYPPTQPAFGDDVFNGCTASFPGSEDDPDIRSRTYTFPTLAVLVEASRGNLDSNANRNGTGLHRGYVLNAGSFAGTNTYRSSYTDMAPQTGYQKAYQRMAMWYSQPIATSLDGADQGFFQKLGALCDCRFGFVGFSDSDPFQGTIPNLGSVATPHTGIWGGAQGTAAYSGKNSYYYDVNFQQAATLGRLIWDGRHSSNSGGSGTMTRNHENNDTQSPSGLPGFRIPRTPLNTGISQSQSLNIVTKGSTASTAIPWSDPNSGDGLYNGRPQSGTMCYEAMETARRHFQNALYDGLSRAGSKRSIVFFTDGIPSGGVASTEATQTQTVANQCRTDGIAIYSIGLNMTGNPSLTADQNTFLGNGSNGLSGRAKNGGRYFECGSVDEVKQAFSAIARRLTQSQR